MAIFDECMESRCKDVRLGGMFGKKLTMSIYVYERHIFGEGYTVRKEGSHYSKFDIPCESIIDATIGTFEGNQCVLIKHRHSTSLLATNAEESIALIGLENPVTLISAVNTARDKRNAYLKKEKEIEQLAIQKREENELKKKKEAASFYQNCYDFHIKQNMPVFTFSAGESEIMAMYIDGEKGLNFLKVNGFTKEETVGLIPYEKIHYYEKAGNVTYTTDIHGKYSSFGGSMTGARFSKFAAGAGGLLFGLMGMAAGALLTYKPAKQEPINTSFTLDSEVVKIDDRNVILNFYSDIKKQYIDIELPQDTYNYLQTYLPEKKYSIVEEIERKTVVHQSKDTIESGASLHPATDPTKLPSQEKQSISMEEFKLKVEKLKMMKEADLLSEEEFKEERKKLLAMI